MAPVIAVKNLTKKFRPWKPQGASIKSLLVRPFSFKQSKNASTQAEPVFKDLTFSIQKGSFVGIMGRNGAGKSTLLKLISGIYTPTSGKVEVTEQIAPLIELGAGFHPDLTGHENIFLNAAVLGVGKKAVSQALPEILSFAGLGDHIHMPVRHYSSGMLVRLGFAVASHLDAPILLIDEVLAVGDLEFQRKCIERIHSLHRSGRTVVLITHDPDTVEKHCTHCIVLDGGKAVFDGSAMGGAEYYRKIMTPTPTE